MINGKAGQNHDWNRPFGGLPLEQPLSRCARLNLPDGEGVIADYPIAVRSDENARRPGCLGMSGIAMEPVV